MRKHRGTAGGVYAVNPLVETGAIGDLAPSLIPDLVSLKELVATCGGIVQKVCERGFESSCGCEQWGKTDATKSLPGLTATPTTRLSAGGPRLSARITSRKSLARSHEWGPPSGGRSPHATWFGTFRSAWHRDLRHGKKRARARH